MRSRAAPTCSHSWRSRHAPELTLVAAPRRRESLGRSARQRSSWSTARAPAMRCCCAKCWPTADLRDGDYTMREFGGSQERFHAIETGHGVGEPAQPAVRPHLFATGFKSLGTSREFFPTYPGPIGATRRSWAQQNKQRPGCVHPRVQRRDVAEDSAQQGEAIGMLPARLDMDAKAAAAAFDDDLLKRSLPESRATACARSSTSCGTPSAIAAARGAPDKYMDLRMHGRGGRGMSGR